MRALPTLIALAALSGQIAQPVAVWASTVASSSADVAQLVDLVVPAETIIAATRAAWGDELAGRFAADDRAVALDRQRPGLRSAYIESGLDEVTTTYAATLATLRADAARVYAEALTPAEIAELLAFFRTPTGAKLVAAMQAGVAASDGADAQALQADGKRAALGAIDESDRPALAAFSRTAVFGKTQKVSALIAEISGIAIAANTTKLAMAVPAATDRTLTRWASDAGQQQ